jgi:hypothetical protein
MISHMYLNSREYIIAARGQTGSNWSNWLNAGPGSGETRRITLDNNPNEKYL